MTNIKKYFQQFAVNSKVEILSGLTVAIALVPEAVAFAFIAGVSPLVGLYAAFLVCLITSLFGGRTGMISGATGALAVVMTSLVATHGVEYLFATVVLMGIFQMLAGIFHLGRFINMVPYSVMIGFVNGLAMVILLSQFSQFKEVGNAGELVWLDYNSLFMMGGIISLTMVIIYMLPKVTNIIPSALAAIIISTVCVVLLNIDTKTVGDVASISGGLPQFHFPMVDINFKTLKIITPYALILAMIGLIESLLTLTLIDDITGSKDSKNAKECFFQGVANFVTGFFGGMGGCAMIGQSMINIKSGGRGRLSGLSAALFLLTFILFFSSLIELIPTATLVGVMFVVVISTFKWSSFKMINEIPRSDFIIIIAVTMITIYTDLAIAVIVGVIISALVFSWNCAKNVFVEASETKTKKTYIVHGQIFFASVSTFKSLFSYRESQKDITIDFKYTRLWDHSALEAIEQIAQKYLKAGKRLHLIHLSPDCRGLLDKAVNCIESNKDDPHYRIAVLNNDEI